MQFVSGLSSPLLCMAPSLLIVWSEGGEYFGISFVFSQELIKTTSRNIIGIFIMLDLILYSRKTVDGKFYCLIL
jgi:hypothetical protein